MSTAKMNTTTISTTTMRSLLMLAACAALALSGCNGRKAEPAATNRQAALTGQLPYNPLAWKAITASTNRVASTASTLYGNDTAVAYARSTPGSTYPAGAVLALVTWSQRDDPHWFGAKIPGSPQTVEFVVIADQPGAQPAYSLYRGAPLARVDGIAADQAASRIDYITHQRAAVMP